ncbi:polysaccharide deacetylase family protein [Actinacidiphila oryziradicis]|uniref:Polysaccharide deacetylase n=1 Tax=Actinacidiphila oryziradicis TaxID=2571141 RepID=A0A4U0SFX7_9ACTN|nr:polysaccharide deacetylase [Actinacidiphila oryziradicis]TKA08490.1 polysaccharide deacetylase [Actinacidiphila oryziradicis]
MSHTITHDTRPRWPDGARCAVWVSFDVDGPTAVTDDKQHGVLDDISLFNDAANGIYRGLPAILQALTDFEVPSTFFIPSKNVEQWPTAFEAVRDAGHELGQHGYLHELFSSESVDRQQEILARSFEIFDHYLGVRTKAFRSPGGDPTPETPKLLLEAGFEYTSIMRGDDRPATWLIDGATTDLVEICAHWELDDYHQFIYADSPQLPPSLDRISSIRGTHDNWRREFDGYYRYGLTYTLMLHPEISGRPANLRALRELLAYMRSKPDVWFATGSQIANWWRTSGQSAENMIEVTA